MIKHIYAIIKRRIKRRLIVAIYRKPKVIRASTRERAQHLLDNYGWPTTRSFPRTTAEAFKDDEYSQWFYPPDQRWRDKAFFAAGVAAWIGIGFYFWKTT